MTTIKQYSQRNFDLAKNKIEIFLSIVDSRLPSSVRQTIKPDSIHKNEFVTIFSTNRIHLKGCMYRGHVLVVVAKAAEI